MVCILKGELLRRQNGEKLQLERELEKDEREALEKLTQMEEDKRKQTIDQMSGGLVGKLQG